MGASRHWISLLFDIVMIRLREFQLYKLIKLKSIVCFLLFTLIVSYCPVTSGCTWFCVFKGEDLDSGDVIIIIMQAALDVSHF